MATYECHFNWNLESDASNINRSQVEAKLLASIDSDVTLKGKAHLLLSCLFGSNDVTHKSDFGAALEYVERVLQESETSSGEQWLSKINKSFILRRLSRDEESLRLRQK